MIPDQKEHPEFKVTTRLLLLTTWAAIAVFVFIEWLFQATKPSYMSVISFPEKISVFIFTFSILSFLAAFAIGVLFIAGLIIKNARTLLVQAMLVIPIFILACLGLLMFDNFTYTIFHFGIADSTGAFRLIYAAAFIFLFGMLYLKISNQIRKTIGNPILIQQSSWRIILPILVIIIGIAIYVPLSYQGQMDKNFSSSGSIATQPHIFLISAEGINASHTSVYEYYRNTTPYMQKLAETSLVSENHFTNSGSTSGSIISILTSKTPFNTRVLFRPDILFNEDSYQHLPGILRSKGYYTAQMSFSYFADAYSLNLRGGFDEANGVNEQKSIVQEWINDFLPTNYSYFIYETANRLADRLRHIFFLKTMVNSFEQLTGKPGLLNDKGELQRLKELMNRVDQPIFVQLHWMGTHGPAFYPEYRQFSLGKDIGQQIPWDDDFYDDGILEFDSFIANLNAELNRRGMADNSLIIITSDHGQQWRTDRRIPLIIHFPGDQHTGRLSANTQNIDIAPTVLGYLGIQTPDWMEGSSLLQPLEPDRIIISASAEDIDEADTDLSKTLTSPPFYQFGAISGITCGFSYSIDLNTGLRSVLEVPDIFADCEPGQVKEDKIFIQMLQYLSRYGFDISSLQQVAIN